MAFKGSLLTIGTYKFPLKYIEYSTYKVTLNTQDLDSKRTTDGVLHRTALSHRVPKVEFDILSDLPNTVVGNIMSHIHDNYVNSAEKSANLTLYIPETDSYMTHKCYLDSSMEFPIKSIDKQNNIIIYDKISFNWTGY